MNNKGFTLLELIIVVAMIAIIAAVAIPGMLRSRLSANETSTIASLRALVTGQITFQMQNVVDQNGNGRGEFGVLGELTGNVAVRVTGLRPAVAFLGAPLQPATANVFASRSGFHFQIHLPGETSTITDNGLVAPPLVGDGVSILQEVKWLCYAWPIVINSSGMRAYAATESGEILFINNEIAQFTGTSNMPPFDSVYVTGDGTIELRGELAIRQLSNAGEQWRTINN